MTGHFGPSEIIKSIIRKRGGHWWTEATDTVAGGTGTAETLVEAYRVPDAGRMLLGWRTIDSSADNATAEPIVSVFSLAGSNYKFQPQQIFGPVASSLFLEGASNTSMSEFYDVFAPVAGGETLNVNVEPLSSVAGNRRVAAEFTWTDIRLNETDGMPVIYSECSREVTVDGAGNSAGTTLNINNAHRLIEAGGVVVQEAQTVEEEINVTLTLGSTAWTPVQNIELLFEPVPGVIDATIDQGEPGAYVTRRSQGIDFTADRASVTAVFDLDVDVTNASTGGHYIRWI